MANGPTRANLQEIIDGLSAELDAARDKLLSEERRASALDKKWGDALMEIDKLKDELHRMTIENARLEGYRDRVLEFDPVTERQAYSDEHRDRRSPVNTFIEGADAQRMFGGVGARGLAPWYRRRA